MHDEREKEELKTIGTDKALEPIMVQISDCLLRIHFVLECFLTSAPQQLFAGSHVCYTGLAESPMFFCVISSPRCEPSLLSASHVLPKSTEGHAQRGIPCPYITVRIAGPTRHVGVISAALLKEGSCESVTFC